MLTQLPRGEAAAFCDSASFYQGEWAYSSIQAGIVDEFVGFCSCCPTRKSLVCFNRVNPESPRSMHVLRPGCSSFEELLLKLMAFLYACGSLCRREEQWKNREEKISLGYRDSLLECSKQQSRFHEES